MDKDRDPFDPNSFAIDQDHPTTTTKLKKRGRLPFTVMPEMWREQLAIIRAQGSTYRVALYLLHEVWRTKTSTVKLTNAVLTQARVSRRGKATALRQLRKAGLIVVEARARKSPIVTVRYVD
jgi:hypothetical protein